jgi:hypothetical protein
MSAWVCMRGVVFAQRGDGCQSSAGFNVPLFVGHCLLAVRSAAQPACSTSVQCFLLRFCQHWLGFQPCCRCLLVAGPLLMFYCRGTLGQSASRCAAQALCCPCVCARASVFPCAQRLALSARTAAGACEVALTSSCCGNMSRCRSLSSSVTLNSRGIASSAVACLLTCCYLLILYHVAYQ